MRLPAAVCVLAATLLVPTAGQTANVIWREAELFDDPGGWVNDAQFIDQMGSPYLLAIGLEKPVADAVAQIDIRAAGKYRLWVRARDWVPEHSPGRFEVLLMGKPAERVFGQSKATGWAWEDGGWHNLPAGKVEVRLHDLTGHYSRCDAIVLCDDAQFRPADDLAKLQSQREQFGGVSGKVKQLGPYDTVVVGGGLAGTFAAVASARMGCRTALVQDRPVLGGNGSTEVLVRPEGDTTREPWDPGEGGIIEEVRGSGEGYSDRMANLCKGQSNLDVYFNLRATGVKMAEPGRIAAVQALEVKTGQRVAVAGKIFIDCTGDGSIGYWAGAEWRHGREPRSMYQESRAPEVADGHTMGGTLRYASETSPTPIAFQAQPWARKFDDCSDFTTGRHPELTFGGWQWKIEYGGMGNTVADAEEIRDELLRIIWGMWDHAKNHCPKLAAEAAKYRLTWVSHVVGKRESRRLMGDYVLTEGDIAATKLFDDRVSYCGWGIDIHPPGGFYDTEPPATFSHKLKFSVPYRCLYSKDVGNLLMAGRCISVSHVALGATRVMITCGLQGQAAGTASGFCKRYEATPRAVGQNYIKDLQQQLLKDGCYLIDLPNSDARDLARGAKVTASSVSPNVEIPATPSSSLHTLTCDRAVMFKVVAGRIGTIAAYLHSKNAKPTPIEAALRPAAALGDFSADKNLATAKATVSAKSQGWVTFPFNAKVEPGYYYFYLPKTAGLSWALFEVRADETMRAYRSGKTWESSGETYRFLLDPTPEQLATKDGAAKEAEPKSPPVMFAAANVIDGFARAIRGVPHSWRPDPTKPMPQWVELDFGKPVRFNSVHVAFQAKWMQAQAFRVEVADGDAWRPVAEVAENTERRRVLCFSPVQSAKLRLVITQAKADMGVCEIRVYDEPTVGH